MKNLRVPFSIDAGKVVTTSSPTVVAEQKIIDVLMTSAAERVGLNSYGAGIQTLVFQPIDSLVEADFKIDALAELKKHISGVQILDMTVRQNPTSVSTADITVWYRLPLSAIQQVTFTIDSKFLTEESPLY